MRLAFCIFKYFPFGGLQRDCLDIAKTCQRRGHDVNIFTTDWIGPHPDKLNLHIVPSRGMTNHGRNLDYVNNVASLLRHNTYDVVIGFNKMPGLDLYFAGDRCYADQSQAKHKSRWNPYYWCTSRFALYTALEEAVFSPESQTTILLLTQSQRDSYMRHYGTPVDRFYELPPGICRDRLPTEEHDRVRSMVRKELLRESEQFLLLAVGSDAQRKGLDRTLRAVAALPQSVRLLTRVVAVGETRRGTFKRLSKRLSVSDRITLLSPSSEIPRYFCGADLLVHPAYSEAGGNVLLESMVFGVPVLATDVCGYAELVKTAQGGVIVPSPFDQEDMNLSLKQLLTTPQLATLAKNALSYGRTAPLMDRSRRAAKLIEARGELNRAHVSSSRIFRHSI